MEASGQFHVQKTLLNVVTISHLKYNMLTFATVSEYMLAIFTLLTNFILHFGDKIPTFTGP
jgi:hypothetical protein